MILDTRAAFLGGARPHLDRVVALSDAIGYDEAMRLGEEVAEELAPEIDPILDAQRQRWEAEQWADGETEA
jgi:hypothetical protein